MCWPAWNDTQRRFSRRWSIEIEEHKVVDPKIVCFQWGFTCLGFLHIFEADLKGKTEYDGWK